ncbi:MAG: DUF5719 family protein [Propionibacteriaceae bacterium]|nr:DUF5719 family protein [Propionibacteriaceae bacterium]
MTAAVLTTAVLAPARAVPNPAFVIEGSRLLGCPVGDSAFGQTKVSAAAESELRSAVLGGDFGEPVAAFEAADPAAPIVFSGDQSLGAVSVAVQDSKLVAQVCGSPVATAWWDGVWSNDVQQSVLVLTNTDSTESIVNVSLIGETGPIEAAGLRQIEIQRYSTRLVSFAAFGVMQESPFSVALHSDRGRVVGTLRSQGELGQDWRAAATAPDTDLVLPAVMPSEGQRYLFITNHGSSRAHVELFGLGAGPALPLAADSTADEVTVASQTSTRVELTQALSGGLTGLEVRSDQPVTATLVATGSDMAGVGAQPALAGGLVLPAVPGAVLAVTNPGLDPVALTLDQRGADGQYLGSVETVVTPGSQAIPLEASDGSYLITPGGSGLRAALIVSQVGDTAGLAIAPLGSGGAVGLSVALGYDPALG